VSQTVRDILVGSGMSFAEAGEHSLKGVPGSWRLFALSAVAAAGEPVEIEASMQTLADRTAVVAARRAPGTVRRLMHLGNSIQHRRARRESARMASAG
jgi:hypothetical protein